MNEIISIFLIAFGTFGITLLITSYDGPFGILYKLRERTNSDLFTCPICCGFWVSIIVTAAVHPSIILWLAGFGVFAFLEHE